MKKITLDGAKISSVADIHDMFSKEFSFPEYYGRNMDALYDCLTDINEEAEVAVINYDRLEYELGKYASAVVKVLTEAAEVNSSLKIVL